MIEKLRWILHVQKVNVLRQLNRKLGPFPNTVQNYRTQELINFHRMDVTCTNGSELRNVSLCDVFNVYMRVTCVLLIDNRSSSYQGRQFNIVNVHSKQ